MAKKKEKKIEKYITIGDQSLKYLRKINIEDKIYLIYECVETSAQQYFEYE